MLKLHVPPPVVKADNTNSVGDWDGDTDSVGLLLTVGAALGEIDSDGLKLSVGTKLGDTEGDWVGFKLSDGATLGD